MIYKQLARKRYIEFMHIEVLNLYIMWITVYRYMYDWLVSI